MVRPSHGQIKRDSDRRQAEAGIGNCKRGGRRKYKAPNAQFWRKRFELMKLPTKYVIIEEMKISQDRIVFTVTRDRELWAVEHLGEYFDHSSDQNEARASANKRAREAQNSGAACQVRVSGETGYFQ